VTEEKDSFFYVFFGWLVLLLLLCPLAVMIRQFCEEGRVSDGWRLWLLFFGGFVLLVSMGVKDKEEEAESA